MRCQRASTPLLFVLAAAGCAATGGAPTAKEDDIRIMESSELFRVRNDTESLGGEVAAPVAAVWNALRAIYEDMEIPIGTFEPAEGRLGSPRFRAQRVAAQRVSRWVDCGSGGLNGPRADSYEVYFTVTTVVETVDAGRTRVATRLDADARPRGYSGNEVHCRSLGRLEAAIVQGVQVRAGATR